MNSLFIRPQVSYVVFASAKSGTTWLQRLLSAHPQAICCESRAFGDYIGSNAAGTPHITLEKYLQVLSGYFAPTIPELQPGSQAYRSLLFNMLDLLAANTLSGTNKRIYGEKFTPYRGTAMNAMLTFYSYNPDIKFIHLIRDGRDVIVSGAAQWLSQRAHTGNPAEQAAALHDLKEHRLRQEDFEMFLDMWIDSAEAGIEAKQRFPSYRQVAYEDILTDTGGMAKNIFGFIGIDDSPDVIHDCTHKTSFSSLSGGRKNGKEDLNSFFRKGIKGDWENWFTDQHKTVFNQRAGHIMLKLGYPI